MKKFVSFVIFTKYYIGEVTLLGTVRFIHTLNISRHLFFFNFVFNENVPDLSVSALTQEVN